MRAFHRPGELTSAYRKKRPLTKMGTKFNGYVYVYAYACIYEFIEEWKIVSN